ncbi:MAG: pseudaminic acid synthase [Candidatus Hodarchaeota archaeon]
MGSLIRIGERFIGPDYPVYIVAELSANHRQQFNEAVKLIEAAKKAGADAVKLQTYTPDTMTVQCDAPEFRISGGTLWDGKTLYDLYGEAYMPWEWQPKLKKVAENLGMDLFSTAYDKTAVDFLEELGVQVYKVASFEIIDIPLIKYIATNGKPMIIATGMATLAEIDEAVQAARMAGACQIALLKCVSAYPAAPEEMNLRTIPHLAESFEVPTGLSDHTLGFSVPVAAVALGACIIEKHFTLSRDIPSPDSGFSLEPQEFEKMVESIRIAEKALGEVSYEITEKQKASQILRRSLFAIKDIRAGEEFSHTNVRSIRPGYGLHTRYLEQVLGRYAKINIRKGTPLSWDLVS